MNPAHQEHQRLNSPHPPQTDADWERKLTSLPLSTWRPALRPRKTLDCGARACSLHVKTLTFLMHPEIMR